MGIACGKCYFPDFEKGTNSPHAERLTFNQNMNEKFLISYILSPEKSEPPSEQNLFELLEEFNVDSFFLESKEKIVNQKIGFKAYLISNHTDLIFNRCEKIWLKVEEHKRDNSIHQIYTYKHLPFSPDLYALSMISFVTSKKREGNESFVHQVLDYSFHNDLLISVWRSTYYFDQNSKDPINFLYVRIFQQLDKNEYFECLKDIKFTNLSFLEKYQNIQRSFKKQGQIHNGSSRWYTNKGKYYRQSYYEIDFALRSGFDKMKGPIATLFQSKSKYEDFSSLSILVNSENEKDKHDNHFFNSVLINQVKQKNIVHLDNMESSLEEIKKIAFNFEKKRLEMMSNLEKSTEWDNIETEDDFDDSSKNKNKFIFPDLSNPFIDTSEIRKVKNDHVSRQLLSVFPEQRSRSKQPIEVSSNNIEELSKINEKKIFIKSSPPIDYDIVNESPKSTMLKTAKNLDFVNAYADLKMKKNQK